MHLRFAGNVKLEGFCRSFMRGMLAVGIFAFPLGKVSHAEPVVSMGDIGPWRLFCDSQLHPENCAIAQSSTDTRSKDPVGVSLSLQADGGLLLRLRVGPAFEGPRKVGILFDGTQVGYMSLATCDAGHCDGSLALDEPLIEKLKSTKELEFALRTSKNEGILLPVNLAQFSEAIDKMRTTAYQAIAMNNSLERKRVRDVETDVLARFEISPVITARRASTAVPTEADSPCAQTANTLGNLPVEIVVGPALNNVTATSTGSSSIQDYANFLKQCDSNYYLRVRGTTENAVLQRFAAKQWLKDHGLLERDIHLTDKYGLRLDTPVTN